MFFPLPLIEGRLYITQPWENHPYIQQSIARFYRDGNGVGCTDPNPVERKIRIQCDRAVPGSEGGAPIVPAEPE
jgi:hypothetical protein